MASGTSALNSQQIAAILDDVALELEDMPEVAAEWPTWSENSQCSYALDWDKLMRELKLVVEAYRFGRMTPDQQAQYQELLGKLKEALPLIRKLNLTHPPGDLFAAA
ncbi:MAG: hypothetical protein HY689_08330 [Chloroflexi bacterium]|nr:hypothetical protein [Chloroflexota bacterium]